MMQNQFSAVNWLRINSSGHLSITLVKNLQDGEKDFDLSYPVFFIFKQRSEEIKSIIAQFETTNSREITMDEFEEFEESRIHGEGRPNNTYNLYQLVNSIIEKIEFLNKIQQYYIDPQLVDQITYQLNNDALVYNPQLTLELGINGQPQQVREIYIEYPPPGTTGSVAESSQQASRRRPRNGGNGNGGNGNGGNGQRGGGRRRRRGGNGNDEE
uniref:Uncharacterized protein n=4 Tax=Meloidogyne TaxID=189290 RepID=A0A6V7X7G8_MELEN|nr:unnamed protein product [Meloidogyne enterolobii]